MPVSEVEKLLGSTGLAELIGRIKAAIAAAGAPPDGVTIDENDDGELEAVMDQEGGVTSYATHLADIVTADETTITKSEENVVGLKPGGIQSGHLSNGCVTTDKIASKAVTSDKLADGSVEIVAIADVQELRAEMGLGDTLGALPIANGGTGSTNAADAIANLGVLDAVYPVGSIYMSTASTSPQVLFGGTWSMIQGRFLLASGPEYPLWSTGGTASHALTASEIPAHSHEIRFNAGSSSSGASRDGTYLDGDIGTSDRASQSFVTATGSISGPQSLVSPHNNMPPYLVVNVWQRTA